MDFFSNIISFFAIDNMPKRRDINSKLIRLLILLFIGGLLLNTLFYLLGRPALWLEWVVLSSDVNKLISRPWTLFTYAFIHIKFFHFVFNLLFLYLIGRWFLFLFTEKMYLQVFLIGIVNGGLFFILGTYLFASIKHFEYELMGVSSGVYALLFAKIFYNPKNHIVVPFFGTVALYKLAIFLLILNIIYLPSTTNTGGALAHMGGAFGGWFYIWQFNRGDFIGRFFRRRLKKKNR